MDNYGYQGEDNGAGRPFAITRYPSSQAAANQYLVGVNTRAKLLKAPVFYQRLSIILFILALLLLIGLLILIILYSKQKQKICISSECLRSASNLKFNLDLNVDPCDDFYQYACGKWSDEHPNHGWYKSFSNFQTISEKILIESINTLTSDKKLENEPKAIQQAKDFYKSCMDIDALDNLGLTTIYKYLTKVGLPEVPSFFTKTSSDNFSFNWIKSEALIKKTFLMDVFIGFLVDANIYNISQSVMYIGSPAQDCPLPSPLKRRSTVKNKGRTKGVLSDEDDDYVETVRAVIFKYIVREVMKNVTSTEPEEELLQKGAESINEMATTIAELILNYTTSELESNGPVTASFKDLQSKVDTSLSKPIPNVWVDYVNYLFGNTNVTIDPDVDLLYVEKSEETYLIKILEYLVDTPAENIELYLWWVSAYAMIINTSSDMIEYIGKITSAVDVDAEADTAIFVRSRSLDCSSLVNDYMDYAVSYTLSDRSFANSTRPKVETMLSEIKEAFMEHVHGIHWMDAYTKRVTLEKSQQMISFIGYPDWLFEEGALDDHYKGLIIKPDTFLDNMMQIIAMHVDEKFNSLRGVNVRDWRSIPINVNAFNSFLDNAINVPMAILKYPIYNLGLEALNYGSIGAILGHELTHGFDNIGRKHDKYGNYVQWWSNKTIDTFESLTDCFVKQYDNFTIKDVQGGENVVLQVKGRETLGENLADNGGLNQAFSAYKKYVKRYGEEQKLPGFENYTSHQLFFLAYANIWCENISLKDLENQIEFDEHSPNHFRVMGTLQNSQDFSNAFQCPKSTNMNPDRERCKIW